LLHFVLAMELSFQQYVTKQSRLTATDEKNAGPTRVFNPAVS
jgi:hypothetical protein